MNFFQRVNLTASFAVIGGLMAGIARKLEDQTSAIDFFIANKDISLFALFLLLFKIKTMLDDHKHFAEPHQFANLSRYVGFILAIMSWVFWGLAAYSIGSPAKSNELMAISILVSTSWIVVHVMEIIVDRERRNAEVVTSLMREKWVLLNILYLLCIVSYLGWFTPIVENGNWKAHATILIVFAFDILTSRSYKNVQ